MRVAKFWRDQMAQLQNSVRMYAEHDTTRFVVKVFYRTKGGRLEYIWNQYATYDEAADFACSNEYTTKGGRKFRLPWDNGIRLGFLIKGDPDDTGYYQLMSYCLPWHVRELLPAK